MKRLTGSSSRSNGDERPQQQAELPERGLK
jgi:hypothetical protein